jgi:hypothetical protein
MTQEFVPYEQALALKELGFDEPCFGYYSEGELILNSHTNNHMQRFRYSAPTFSQAFRWLREKYGLYSWITIELGNKSTFCWVLSGEHTSTQYAAYFHTYEEAELACLIKLIEIVKQNQ